MVAVSSLVFSVPCTVYIYPVSYTFQYICICIFYMCIENRMYAELGIVNLTLRE